jgi:hypothetical protein
MFEVSYIGEMLTLTDIAHMLTKANIDGAEEDAC